MGCWILQRAAQGGEACPSIRAVLGHACGVIIGMR